MFEVNPISSLPQNSAAAVPDGEEIERRREKKAEARGRVDQRGDQHSPQGVTSEGHAGPGGQKGSHLDVTA